MVSAWIENNVQLPLGRKIPSLFIFSMRLYEGGDTMDLRLIFEFVIAMTICDLIRGFLAGVIRALDEGIKESVEEVKKANETKKERPIIYGFVDKKDEA